MKGKKHLYVKQEKSTKAFVGVIYHIIKKFLFFSNNENVFIHIDIVWLVF